MIAFLNLVPRWVWMALVAALTAASCKLAIDLSSVTLELETSKIAVAQMEAAIAVANTEAANRSAALSNAVLKAQNEAKSRETSLRAAATAAATESDGLRDDLAAMRDQYDQLSHDAIIERATAVNLVFDQCQRRYQGLAEKADRHSNDLRTLMDAWPR